MSKKFGKTQLKIALSGASGRMGQEIQALISEGPGFLLKHVIGAAPDWKKIKSSEVDVVIDFSSPEGLQHALRWCVGEGKPLVSGTTGVSVTEYSKLIKAGGKIPVLHAANMSLGVAVMGAMLKSFGPVRDWDFQIEEAHHSLKKDKPSGTALLLQDQLTKVAGRPLPTPNSIRGGGTPGIHAVWAMGPDEAIVLQHTAFNRKVFARGALHAARWLFDKKDPGLYDLTDLYNS
jgi:4-hydroxy-tetrahydrodipicolinate reductase